MKKILLSILTLAMSGVAMADDIIVMDSLYHEKPNGEVTNKEFYSYDQDGKILTMQMTRSDGSVMSIDKYIYNAVGLVERIDTYGKDNVTGEFFMGAYFEYKNFVDGQPTENFAYKYDQTKDDFILISYTKVVKMENGVPVELEIYDAQNGMTLGAHHVYTLNDKGQIEKKMINSYGDGMEGERIEIFEYDERGNVAVNTNTFEFMGITTNSVYKYEYEYGIYDTPVKITSYLKLDDAPMVCSSIEERFYSSLHTGIHNVMAPMQSSSAIYDMMGREVSEEFRGIVIQNGRKMVKK